MQFESHFTHSVYALKRYYSDMFTGVGVTTNLSEKKYDHTVTEYFVIVIEKTIFQSIARDGPFASGLVRINHVSKVIQLKEQNPQCTTVSNRRSFNFLNKYSTGLCLYKETKIKKKINRVKIAR